MDPKRRVKRLVVSGILIACLWWGGALPVEGRMGQADGRRLFGSVEFRTTLEVLPLWERIRADAAAQVQQLAARKEKNLPQPILQWQQMLEASKGLAVLEKLERVNRFFNRWPYRLDQEVYNTSDYWATPEEFMMHSGDCEDYGIAKYFTLRHLGVDKAQMRLVVVKDRIRGIGHAVLVVYLPEAVYILDNLTDQVLPHTRYRHYVPQYSVNEDHGWAHLPSTSVVGQRHSTES